MSTPSATPSVRDLIAELAALEDRMRSAEALVHGGVERPNNPELVSLARREAQLLAMLHRHRSSG
jgi:hypothetical protein